jgi:hypothetical protein
MAVKPDRIDRVETELASYLRVLAPQLLEGSQAEPKPAQATRGVHPAIKRRKTSRATWPWFLAEEQAALVWVNNNNVSIPFNLLPVSIGC